MPGRTGSDLASFLLGVPQGGARRLQAGSENGGWVNGFYFGDQWRASSRLTVNWGLRWDMTRLTSWGGTEDGTIYVGVLNFDNGSYILQTTPPPCSKTGKAPCLPGDSLPAHVTVADNGRIYPGDYKNFAPRLGLAYRLGIEDGDPYRRRHLLRKLGHLGAAGTELWSGMAVGQSAPGHQSEPERDRGSCVKSAERRRRRSAAGAHSVHQLQTFKDPFMKIPYAAEWNFGIQQQLGSSTTLSVDYVGSHGSRLDLNTFVNTARTPGPGPQIDRRPFSYITPTNFERTNGRSSYEALELGMNRRMSTAWATWFHIPGPSRWTSLAPAGPASKAAQPGPLQRQCGQERIGVRFDPRLQHKRDLSTTDRRRPAALHR